METFAEASGLHTNIHKCPSAATSPLLDGPISMQVSRCPPISVLAQEGRLAAPG
jgi:hypothetical protein